MPDPSRPMPPVTTRAAHYAAWVVACTTFPLIWMGGLVTTYGAGMAVPDWPGTYGYNLFLYPLESWIRVWDVFLEHGHRLLGSAVGLATIALAVLLWRRDSRPVLWWLAGIALLGVCLQGVLGGLRVVGSGILHAEIAWMPAPVFLSVAAAGLVLVVQAVPAGIAGRCRASFWIRAVAVSVAAGLAAWFGVLAVEDRLILAKAHGCTAPAFFALAVAIVVQTSPRWVASHLPVEAPGAARLQRLTFGGALALYVQIVLGANLRHIAPDAAPWWFTLWVWLHVIVAGGIVLLVGWQFVAARRHAIGRTVLGRRIWLLAGLFAVQLTLGLTTWVTNYGWPRWFTDNVFPLQYTVVAESFWQALSTTAHVAVGSLCLAAATSAALWARRQLKSPIPGGRPEKEAAPRPHGRPAERNRN
ncbi:MAG: COX15/CtaA family protein [Thermoguttaceae bacterium]